MRKAVVVFSGGIDSICIAALLKKRYDLYGITFTYGQRANREVLVAKRMAKKLLVKHVISDIQFMKSLYGDSNVLTDSKSIIPSFFDYSIVVPIRNAVFLSIASAWAFSINAKMVAYGAHKNDVTYPDCRPRFTKKMQDAINLGEIDGIKSGLREEIEIWSPYVAGFTKSQLLKKGYAILKDEIFNSWSCYANKTIHCGNCESCQNRIKAFAKIKLVDKTKYAR